MNNGKFRQALQKIRRDGWKDHPIVLPELDLIQESDQITHTTSLLDQVDPEEHLNVFKFDPEFLANEAKYAEIRAALFESNEDSEAESDGENEGEDSDESGDEDDDGDEEDEEHKRSAAATAENQQTIIDQTETNLVHLRRTIYLMLQSSLSADEAGHRLLQLKIKPGEEYEVASMVLDCCAQTRSYESRYGRLAQRLCRVVFPSSTPSSTGSTTVSVSSDLGPGSRYRSNKEVSKPTAKEETPAPVVEESGPPVVMLLSLKRFSLNNTQLFIDWKLQNYVMLLSCLPIFYTLILYHGVYLNVSGKKESESKNKLSSSVLGDISISSSSSSSSSSSGDSSSSESESSCSNDEKHRKKRKHSKDKHKLQKKSHSNRHHDEHHQQHKSYKHTSSKHSEMPSDRISKHSDSTHKNDKRSRLKTRPVDTPFSMIHPIRLPIHVK
ncbi:pre-mRNA-splicing factor cwc22 [Schistosoma haematobium]|uniref:Pre-mRNA-splicing factor cwc22 n=1 Tax=Schistosoma haematobium TaxID=6185 RepID=A0A922S4Q0_SCHHA|nr:pre-mRNA-splicing factor cwc22 [Schistosoma haematobium]KAH9593735.1 pre-mRNA-splicing factor cwc22 [Schistosoma haematobium]